MTGSCMSLAAEWQRGGGEHIQLPRVAWCRPLPAVALHGGVGRGALKPAMTRGATQRMDRPEPASLSLDDAVRIQGSQRTQCGNRMR